MNQTINVPLLTEQVREQILKENKEKRIELSEIQIDELVTREVRKRFKDLLK